MMMAEMLAAGMNSVPGLFNDTRYAAARVERQVVDWMKVALGMPAEASGVFTSGGSVANLIGLAVGRDARGGVSPNPLVGDVHALFPFAVLGLRCDWTGCRR